MPKHTLSEESFSDIQPKPALTQLQAILSGLVIGHQRRDISSGHCTTPLAEEAVDCCEVSPQSPLL